MTGWNKRRGWEALTEPNKTIYINPSYGGHCLLIAVAENEIFGDHLLAKEDGHLAKEVSKTTGIDEFLLRLRLSFARQALVIGSVKVRQILGVWG